MTVLKNFLAILSIVAMLLGVTESCHSNEGENMALYVSIRGAVNIPSVEGQINRVLFEGGGFGTPDERFRITFEMEGKTMNYGFWNAGSEWVIKGKVDYAGCHFEANPKFPLSFKLTGKGLRYLSGIGKVKSASGKETSFPEKSVEQWLLVLRSSKEVDNKQGAAQALGYLFRDQKSGPEIPKVIDALKIGLKDKAWQVRRDAAASLGQIGSEDASDALVPLLSDNTQDWWVAEVAAAALFKIGHGLSTLSIQKIENMLASKNPKMRLLGVQALAAGAHSAVMLLQEMLKNEKDISVKEAAEKSIERLK